MLYTTRTLRFAALLLCAVVLLTAPVGGAADPFAIRTALDVPAHRNTTVSVQAGGVLEFSAADLERRVGLGSGELQGITVTSVPAAAQGGLFLDGVEIEPYEYLDRAALDRLCFAASEVATGAMISFIPQAPGGVTTNLTIQITEGPNRAPILEDSAVTTMQNVPVSGTFTVRDSDGDSVRVELQTLPGKGVVRIYGNAFSYEPYLDKSGADSFTVYAVDAHGAYSETATVRVEIEKNRASIHYVDMQNNPSQYAAIKLHEHGVFTGQRLGASWFFEPRESMTRGEYLVLLVAAGGYEDEVTATVNTGLPNDAEIPLWLKKYVARAIEVGILSPDQPFYYRDVPTRAEAVVLCDRAAGIDDVKDYTLTMADAGSIPRWALSAYRDLAAYQMLDLYDGAAYPSRALDNAYAADLAWQLYKHRHR